MPTLQTRTTVIESAQNKVWPHCYIYFGRGGGKSSSGETWSVFADFPRASLLNLGVPDHGDWGIESLKLFGLVTWVATHHGVYP